MKIEIVSSFLIIFFPFSFAFRQTFIFSSSYFPNIFLSKYSFATVKVELALKFFKQYYFMDFENSHF